MARLAPKLLTLRECERTELEKLLNRRSTPQQIALRAQIILLADKGNNNREIGGELNISRFMARRWRNRWLELSERSIPVIEGLQDEERSGKPAKFSMEQVVELFALACCEPEGQIIESDLDAQKWHLIMDCLNTHQSEYESSPGS